MIKKNPMEAKVELKRQPTPKEQEAVENCFEQMTAVVIKFANSLEPFIDPRSRLLYDLNDLSSVVESMESNWMRVLKRVAKNQL